MSGEPRRLKWRVRAVLAVSFMSALALSAAVPVALRVRRAEAAKRAETENLLRRRNAHARALQTLGVTLRPPGDDPTGMRVYWETFPSVGGGARSSDLDGWERSIHYRAPGPIHARGWDVWSCGPDGIDERGGGDDIVLGEDVAAVGSAERAKLEATMRDLWEWRQLVRFAVRNHGWVPRAEGDPADPTGERALLGGRAHHYGPFVDAWGRPLRYRAPGPLHRTGWDLWSFGPNGIDEQGDGDDILIGQDVATVRT